MQKQKLVLFGAGFVGTWIATHACPALAASFDVTLISEEPRFTFSPLLINGLAGDLTASEYTIDLTTPARERGFTFLQGSVEELRRDAREATVVTATGERLNVRYDVSVLGTGSRVNFFSLPGAEEHALVLKRLNDVTRIVDALRTSLRTAAALTDEAAQRRTLTFVVVGGGPTGVELLGALQTRLQMLAREQRCETLLARVSFQLIEHANLLFRGFPESMSRGSKQILEQHGVQVRCGTAVKDVTPANVTLSDGTILPYGLLFWAAGVTASVPNITPALPAGPIVPDAQLRIDEYLFSAGDAIQFEQGGVTFHKTAQFALQMARDVLANICRAHQQKPLQPAHGRYSAALVTVLDTGFLRIGSLVLRGTWVHALRKFIYRVRLWQIRSGK